MKQEGLQSKLDGNYQQEIPTKPGQSERVENDLNAKLHSVLTCIGGLQAEINALKNASANSATSANAQPLSAFASGMPFFPPVAQLQQRSSENSNSEVNEAMKLMAATTYMSSVQNFFRSNKIC